MKNSLNSYNHDRTVEDFKEAIKDLKPYGLIGISQMWLEDTFIFSTESQAKKAGEKFEEEGTHIGWWYSKKGFEKEKADYEKEWGTKVRVHWLNK